MKTFIYWLTTDLRHQNNEILDWAIKTGTSLIPVFIIPTPDKSRPKVQHDVWRDHALQDFQTSLLAQSKDVYVAKNVAQLAPVLATVDGIVYSRQVDITHAPDVKLVKDLCLTMDKEVKRIDTFYALDPTTIFTTHGKTFSVFTPYWTTVQPVISAVQPVVYDPKKVSWTTVTPALLKTTGLTAFTLPVQPTWAKKVMSTWTATEDAALNTWHDFLSSHIADYAIQRDLPAKHGTSKIAPYLHHGQISIRKMLGDIFSQKPAVVAACATYVKELAWREFAAYLLVHNPGIVTKSFQSRFDSIAWQFDPVLLKAWKTGNTGYPIVDAGMRELWATGWMHNRVRMVVASFLVKHLLHDWKVGEQWFADTLLEADDASNSFGWQWSAGCGADAAPYFRIFNPTLQAKRFDPAGDYIKKWVPELAKLPAPFIYEPSKASAASALAKAGIVLGKDYPLPIVDHTFARTRALKELA